MKQYCKVHNKKEFFISEDMISLHEIFRGAKKKACKKCVERGHLNLSLSGQLQEICYIHPKEHLWLAGTEEDWMRMKNAIKAISLSPTVHYEHIVPKLGKGKINP